MHLHSPASFALRRVAQFAQCLMSLNMRATRCDAQVTTEGPYARLCTFLETMLTQIWCVPYLPFAAIIYFNKGQ